MFTQISFNGHYYQDNFPFKQAQLDFGDQCDDNQNNKPILIRSCLTQPEAYFNFLQKKSSSQSLNECNDDMSRNKTHHSSTKGNMKDKSNNKAKDPLKQIFTSNTPCQLTFEQIVKNAINEKKELQMAEKELKKKNKIKSIKMHQRMRLEGKQNNENISPQMEEDW